MFRYLTCSVPATASEGAIYTNPNVNRRSEVGPRNNYMGVFDGYQNGDMVYTGDRSKLAFFSAVRATSIRNILDGTSHTMAMAEGLTGPAGIF